MSYDWLEWQDCPVVSSTISPTCCSATVVNLGYGFFIDCSCHPMPGNGPPSGEASREARDVIHGDPGCTVAVTAF
eukprot:2175035-Rhodomonas_salina.3